MKLLSKLPLAVLFIGGLCGGTQSMELMSKCPVLNAEFFLKNRQTFADTPGDAAPSGNIKIDGNTWDVYNTFGEDQTFLETVAKPNMSFTIRTAHVTSRGRDHMACTYRVVDEHHVLKAQVTLLRKRLTTETILEGHE